MSLIKISGNGSGTGVFEITSPSTNTNRTQTLPDATGTLFIPGNASAIISSTAVASTSGTSIDFTSIPSWVKRVTVMFNGVSTNGSAGVGIRVGAGSVQTTGYGGASFAFGPSSVATSNFTSAFSLFTSSGESAAATRSGSFVLTLQNSASNIWTGVGSVGLSNTTYGVFSSGVVAVSGVLDRVSIYTLNSTDTFDAGSINILYE